jgi:hypothetical protein
VYSLFNFDKDVDLVYKITNIRAYYLNVNFYDNLIECLWKSVLVLIATYVLINVGRFIVEFFEKVVTPSIYKLFGNTKIVTRAIHNDLKKELKDAEVRFEEENKKRLNAQAEVERLEKKIIDLNNKKNKDESLISRISAIGESDAENDNSRIDVIMKKIGKDKYLNDIINLITQIKKETRFRNDNEIVDYAIRLGLIEYKEKGMNGTKIYKFTQTGRLVAERITDKHVIGNTN